MLTIILGKPKTGKTESILERTRKLIANDPLNARPLVLLPSSTIREKFSIDFAAESGYAGKIFLTISEVLELALQQSQTHLRRISNFESFLLIKEILKENRNRFAYFKNIEQNRGVIHQIHSLISEMRAFHLSESKDSAIHTIRAENDKLADLAMILQMYEQQLEASNLYDEYALYKLGAKMLELPQSIDRNALFIDGFYDFTHTQMFFIQALIRRFEKKQLEIRIALPDIPQKNIVETRESLMKSFRTEIIEMKPNSDYRYRFFDRSRKWDANPKFDIKFFEIDALGKYRETELIANEILRLVIAKGYRFEEIGVILPAFDSYADYISSIFRRNGIPYYSTRDESLISNPLMIYLFAFIQYVRIGIDSVGITAIANSTYTQNPEWKKLSGFAVEFGDYFLGTGEKWKAAFRNKMELLQQTAGIDDAEPDAAQRRVAKLQSMQSALFDLLDTVFDIRMETLGIDGFILWLAKLFEKSGATQSVRSNKKHDQSKDYAAVRKLQTTLKAIKKSADDRRENRNGLRGAAFDL